MTAEPSSPSEKPFKQNIVLRVLVRFFMFANYETVWKLVCVLFSLIASGLLYLVFQCDNFIQQNSVAQVGDLKLVILVILLVSVYKYLAFVLLKPYFLWYLDTERFATDKDREKRAVTMTKLACDLPVYLSITALGFFVLKDAQFMSPALFGKGECKNILMYFPNTPPTEYLSEYMLIQLGLHAQTLLAHLFINFYDKKYYEFLLHHGMATFLIMFSIFINVNTIGSVVVFMHDFSDIFLVMLRIYADFRNRYKPVVYVLFLMTACSWFYCRILYFPYCLIQNSLVQGLKKSTSYQFNYFFTYLNVQLIMLFVMHCYWFLYLVKSLIFYNAPVGVTKKYDDNVVKIQQKYQQKNE